jgi:hypothetical protein
MVILWTLCAMPFVTLWSLKNRAELSDRPILYLRGQGQVICFVSYTNPLWLSCSTCNDSLRAFRLKIQQTKLTNGLHYLLYSNCLVWPCFLLDEAIIWNDFQNDMIHVYVLHSCGWEKGSLSGTVNKVIKIQFVQKKEISWLSGLLPTAPFRVN